MINTNPPENLSRHVPIAVTGIGCWYPGARNPRELWENILARRLEFRKIPDCRLPNSEYCDPTAKSIDHTYAERCAVIDGFEFDWIGRRIPKSMFESTDLVHWLSLDVAEKALSDAGYTPQEMDRDRTGVIVGNTLTSDITRAETMRLRWPFVKRVLAKSCEAHGLSGDAIAALESSMETMYKSVFAPPTPDTLAGGLANTIAGRVCNYFDFHGGGYIVDGACSSSLLAVCTAARALAAGEMNVALAGGVDVSIDPFELVGFSRAGALSRGDMNVYDKAAAGFIAGEGCGFVVLKRLEDARRDGDQVYAILRGWGVSSDGKGGIMTPSDRGQAMAIQRAYEGLDYSPADLDFVEGHGTGTRVGDQIELQGIFEAQSTGQQPAARRTGMTSLKSIIGHTKAAAGIGAFIKATMAVNRRVLPPTGSCTLPNPIFQSKCTSLYPLKYGARQDASAKLRAGVSAMGFGGINSHVTLESGDLPHEKLSSAIDEEALMASSQTSEIFPLTAANYTQLIVEVKNLKESVALLSVGDLADLSLEMMMRAGAQKGLPIRGALIAGSVDQLIDACDTLLAIVNHYPPEEGEATQSHTRNVWIANRSDQSRIGFLFPGQGSQQLVMARKLVARYEWARELVAAADRVQASAGLPTLSRTVFVDVQRALDNVSLTEMRKALANTEVAQMAIVATSLLYSKFLERLGIQPVVCGGHSLGELTALYQAGAYDLDSLLKLVSLRGRAMAAPGEQAGAMAALFCSRKQAEEWIAGVDGYVVIANVNTPNQLVVSGDEVAVRRLMQTAAESGVSSARLNVSNAFHSRYVQPAAQILKEQAPVPQRPVRMDIDVYSCVHGGPVPASVELRDYLSQQVVTSVDFVTMVRAIESQCDMLIEVGPNQVLSKMTSETLAASEVRCLPVAAHPDSDCELNKVLARCYVNGTDIRWEEIFSCRLARKFVPAAERRFIVNPCQKPIADVADAVLLQAVPANLASEIARSDEPAIPETSGNADEPPRSANGSIPQGLAARMNFNPTDLASSPVSPPESQVEPTKPSNKISSSSPVNIPQPESTPRPPQSVAQSDGIESLIVEIISERTGFPAESITPDLRLLDDLNMDSIKAGDVIATAARRLGALGPIDPASLADASIADVVAAVREAKSGETNEVSPANVERAATPAPSDSNMQPAPPNPRGSMPSPQANSTSQPMPAPIPTPKPRTQPEPSTSSADDGVESLIMEIISERTGFPKETLTGELRLLDDLNMDSIKAGDIIATAARKLGALGPIDPASLADASIHDVVVAVRQAKSGEPADFAGTADEPTPTSSPVSTSTSTSTPTSNSNRSPVMDASPVAAERSVPNKPMAPQPIAGARPMPFTSPQHTATEGAATRGPAAITPNGNENFSPNQTRAIEPRSAIVSRGLELADANSSQACAKSSQPCRDGRNC